MTYEGARTLVLGASGFVGRHLARALAARGADVIATARDLSALQRVAGAYGFGGERSADLRALDVTDRRATEALVESVAPAIVFNAVGYGVDRAERDEATALEINSTFVERLAEIVRRHRNPNWRGLALVHLGSALEVGDPSPATMYGRTKLDGTQRLAAFSRRSSLPAITARLFTVYGPGEHPGRLLPTLFAVKDAPLDFTLGTQRRDFTYVEEVVSILLDLGECSTCGLGEVIDVATGRLETVRSFIDAAAVVLGIHPNLIRFGALPQRPDELEHGPISIDRLRVLVGRAPSMTVTEGIRAAATFSGCAPVTP